MIMIIFIRFRPRILIDVSKIDMATTILGFNISMPIMIAPTAMQKMAHPEGKILLFFGTCSFSKDDKGGNTKALIFMHGIAYGHVWHEFMCSYSGTEPDICSRWGTFH